MTEDLIEVCDDQDNLTGETVSKHVAHKSGVWHRVAHVWLFNDKKEILLQLRAKDKALYPDMWDGSCAGHVDIGEDVTDAALREMSEEIGIQPDHSDFSFWKVYPSVEVYQGAVKKEFFYVYFLRFNGKIEDIHVQTEEVQEVRFFTVGQVKVMLDQTPEKMTPHGEYWDDVLSYVEQI